MDPYIETILQLSSRLLQFDPNYTYDESGDADMQEDEDDGWGSDFNPDEMG